MVKIMCKLWIRIDKLFWLHGVRLGYAISPILFCFFLNDLKGYVTVDSHGIDIQICNLFLLLFADDLVMFVDSKVELQRLIDNLANYCKTFKRLEANAHTKCWAKDVKDILLTQGFGYAWYNQGVGNIVLLLRNFKKRNRDIDINCWHVDTHNMDRLRTYKNLKTNFGCERFLKDISISSYKQVFVKFRGGL